VADASVSAALSIDWQGASRVRDGRSYAGRHIGAHALRILEVTDDIQRRR
jgi:hypothetical protein